MVSRPENLVPGGPVWHGVGPPKTRPGRSRLAWCRAPWGLSREFPFGMLSGPGGATGGGR
eukprot:3022996-Pyramimonas_sp.AAC.1